MKRSLPSIITGIILILFLGLYMTSYQVRLNEVAVVRTFGRIVEPKLARRFAVPPTWRDELDKGTIPGSLRETFRENQAPLSDSAVVVAESLADEERDQQVQRRWRIIDRAKRYVLRVEPDPTEPDRVGLNVYEWASKDMKTEPGFYWKWPWPIQRVVIYDNRLQMTETTGEETQTRDAKNIIVTTAIGWRIDDPYSFHIKNHDMPDAQGKLQTRVKNDQKTVIANYDFVKFVSTDKDEIQYKEIEEKIHQAVAQRAKDDYGIRVEYVGIAKLALPKRITEDVFSAMKEERNAEAARYTSAGESEAARIKADAESIAGTILAFAQRKADEIVAEGKRRAAEYNRTFSQDPDLAIFLLEMDYLGDILKQRTTIILDAKPPFDLLGESESAAGQLPATQPAVPGPAGAAGVALPEVVQPK